jgi:hypothetical protein
MHANITASWKGLSGTNTAAYFVLQSLWTKKKRLCDVDTWGKYYKTFLSVIYKFLYQAREFVRGKLFHLSVMFAGEAGAYPSESPFR